MADPTPKRHPCPDCQCCLQCSENRCRLCRKAECRQTGKKLSMAEQIELFERTNAQALAIAEADAGDISEQG